MIKDFEGFIDYLVDLRYVQLTALVLVFCWVALLLICLIVNSAKKRRILAGVISLCGVMALGYTLIPAVVDYKSFMGITIIHDGEVVDLRRGGRFVEGDVIEVSFEPEGRVSGFFYRWNGGEYEYIDSCRGEIVVPELPGEYGYGSITEAGDYMAREYQELEFRAVDEGGGVWSPEPLYFYTDRADRAWFSYGKAKELDVRCGGVDLGGAARYDVLPVDVYAGDVIRIRAGAEEDVRRIAYRWGGGEEVSVYSAEAEVLVPDMAGGVVELRVNVEYEDGKTFSGSEGAARVYYLRVRE